jgi:lysozyme
MKISDRGLDLIKRFEGLELEAYQDVVGIWTIGYGHTSMAGPPDVVPGMEISEREAEKILKRDLQQYEEGVEKAVKAEITQNMYDALVSITYNIGVSAMKRSTFIKRLNNKQYEAAAEAMHWWNKAGGRVVQGLKNRREAEAALFLEGYINDSDSAGNDPRGVPVEENTPRRGSLHQSRTIGGAGLGGAAGSVAAGSVLLGGSGEEAEDGQETSGSTPDRKGEMPGDTGSGEQAGGADGSTTGSPAGEDGGGSHKPVPSDSDPLPPIAADIPDNLSVGVLQAKADDIWQAMQKPEGQDAVVVAAGALAALAAVYVMLVRVDDWRNHKR